MKKPTPSTDEPVTPWRMVIHCAAGLLLAVLVPDALGWDRTGNTAGARGPIALFAPLSAALVGYVAASSRSRQLASAVLREGITVALCALVSAWTVDTFWSWPARLGSFSQIYMACFGMAAILLVVVRGLTWFDRRAGRADPDTPIRAINDRAAWLALATLGAIGGAIVLAIRRDRTLLDLYGSLAAAAACLVTVAWLLGCDVAALVRMRRLRIARGGGYRHPPVEVTETTRVAFRDDLTARRLGTVLALSGFALASFIIDLELPLRPAPEHLSFVLAVSVGLPFVMGGCGLLLGARDSAGRALQSFLTAIALLPVAVVVAVLVAVQFEMVELWLALRRYGGLSLVAPLVALTWSRMRVPVPLTSPAASSALRSPWTVPALFISASQVHIAHAVDFVHRNQEPALTKALGVLGAVALVAFAVVDGRLLTRIQRSLVISGESRSEARDEQRLEGFAAASYVKRSLSWNIVCAILAAGCVLWAFFNGGGTYDW